MDHGFGLEMVRDLKKNAGPYSVRSKDSKFLLDLVRSVLTFQPGYSHRSRSVLGKMFNFRTTQHQRNQRNQKNIAPTPTKRSMDQVVSGSLGPRVSKKW